MATATLPAETETAPPPDTLYEVIGSEVVEKPPMGAFECRLAFLIGRKLEDFAEAPRLGQAAVETLFDLRPAVDRQRRPDAAFVSSSRWPLRRPVPGTSAWKVVPDLAVEVVSPSNSATAVLGKVGEYFRAGVRLVWVVYPDQRVVFVYDSPLSARGFGDGDELDGGDVVPGFRLGVSDFFGEPEDGG